MAATLTARTPISYLLEVSSRRGITPQYDLIATEGRVHEPTFVFRCRAGQFTSTGKGTNKKIARHVAAQGVLTQMLVAERNLNDHPDIEIPQVPAPDSEELGANPVGQLQEMAQRNKWLPPTYEYETDPESHDFVCIVKMSKMEERGTGRSKKLAKKRAAYLLLEAVQDEDNIPSDMRPADEDPEEMPLSSDSVTIPIGASSQAEDDAQLDVTGPHMVGLKLKYPKGVEYSMLKSCALEETLNEDYVEKLRAFAEEQKLVTQYHELPAPADDVYLMLVEVNLKPVVIYYGQGRTLDTCKNQAARNMLECIQKMIVET